ncbi:hypothetical protein [Tateyamaria sp.]|uniref:hypothetical protein n=1 Tax=Tateyamaria sp. TaxID=1929288 RepID=UPI00329ACF23
MTSGPETPPKATEPSTFFAQEQERPANAFEAAWPFNADSPHAEGVMREDAFLSVMLVDVTGLEWETISTYLKTVHDTAKAKNMVPVFVVDLVDFRGLIAESLAYDTLPNVVANAPLDADLDWPSYLAWRRHLLRKKWLPAAIINLGRNADWDAP